MRPTPRLAAFTLIELILVMSMMLIVLSLIGPSLSGFFRGRTLDSEARRFLTLTRYAQSRAVSEGIPMNVWIDTQRRLYGVEAEISYTQVDEHAKEYGLGADLQIEVEQSPNRAGLGSLGIMSGSNLGGGRNGMQIHFLPDGSISETSPSLITLREVPRDGVVRDAQASSVYIGQSLNRLNYEIQTNRLASIRR